jgi:hypothetical protein
MRGRRGQLEGEGNGREGEGRER